MSPARKKIEITSPLVSLGGSAMSIGVRFYYPNHPEKGWRGNLTIDAETKEELKEKLKQAWRWKKPSAISDELIEEMKDVSDIDWEES